MPYHTLSEAEKGYIIAKIGEGWSQQQIADEINCSKSAIQKLNKKWVETGDLSRVMGSGRPRKTTPVNDNELVEYVRQNPFSNSIQAKEETNFPASVRTARKRLREQGLFNCVSAKKPRLTDVNKEARVEFANNFLNQNAEYWERVVFSDEKIFQSCYNGQLRVYRPRNHKFDEEYLHKTDNSGRFSVHVWAWISSSGAGIIHIVEGRLTGNRYVEILNDVMLPSVQERFDNDFVFQHVTLYDLSFLIKKIYFFHFKDNSLTLQRFLGRQEAPI